MFASITTYTPRLWAKMRAGLLLVAYGVTVSTATLRGGFQHVASRLTTKHPHLTPQTPPAPLQPPTAASSDQYTVSSSALYTHVRHAHTPRNVNERHADERTDLNSRIAVWLTSHVGTMWCAYLFALLAAVTIFAVLGLFGVLSPLLAAVGAAVSQTFIQLVLLPVIMVGQNVLNRHAELAADEAYHNIVRLLHEQDQHKQHLDAQDAELLAHRMMLATLQAQSPHADAPFPRDARSGRFMKRATLTAPLPTPAPSPASASPDASPDVAPAPPATPAKRAAKKAAQKVTADASA